MRPKKDLTFSKCLEMKLQDHIQTIAKVAEVAGKEYSIEQVWFINLKIIIRKDLLKCEIKERGVSVSVWLR